MSEATNEMMEDILTSIETRIIRGHSKESILDFQCTIHNLWRDSKEVRYPAWLEMIYFQVKISILRNRALRTFNHDPLYATCAEYAYASGIIDRFGGCNNKYIYRNQSHYVRGWEDMNEALNNADVINRSS